MIDEIRCDLALIPAIDHCNLRPDLAQFVHPVGGSGGPALLMTTSTLFGISLRVATVVGMHNEIKMCNHPTTSRFEIRACDTCSHFPRFELYSQRNIYVYCSDDGHPTKTACYEILELLHAERYVDLSSTSLVSRVCSADGALILATTQADKDEF